ncbi:hypothetical protein CL638_01420 [bacterium]|nr:hypothetical protein [bacterium]|tara:strand:+ start:592 stop:945 length:354 start_codon:yes stop_codon:yes gene_type:complete
MERFPGTERVDPMVEETVHSSLMTTLEELNLGITSTITNDVCWIFRIGHVELTTEGTRFIQVSNDIYEEVLEKILTDLEESKLERDWTKIIYLKQDQNQPVIVIDRSNYNLSIDNPQ